MKLVSVKQAYREYLQTRRGADIYREFKRILYGQDDSLANEISRVLTKELSTGQREKLKACDIGGGDGDRISRVIRSLHKEFGTCVDLDFIEQSKIYIDEFVPEREIPFCAVHKIPGLFEDAHLVEKCYDIVFLIHSIFAFQDEEAVNKTLSLVKKGGLIIVVTNAGDSFLGGLKKLVDKVHPDNRYEMDALTENLEARGIRYDRKEFLTRWSIEEESPALNVLLGWISLGRYAGESDPLHEEIMTYIEDHSTVVGARRLFHEKEVVLLIPEQANLFARAENINVTTDAMRKPRSVV